MKNFTITGKAVWAKVQGDPGPGYNADELEWSIDVEPNEESLVNLKKWGLEGKIKTKDQRAPFITFKRTLNKKTPDKNGKTTNSPIPVLNPDKTEFTSGLVGNGSDIRVVFGVFNVPPNAKYKFKGGLKPVIYEVYVDHLVPYEAPTKEVREPTQGANDKETWSA